MSKIAARGAFIVVEGLDKTGKSTHCTKLVSRLAGDGVNVQLLLFPDRETQIGKLINDYLQRKVDYDDHAIHLLFSANRWELVPKVKKLLLDGVTLIVDRYAYSGVVFSAAKKGMDLNWCVQPDVGLPKPDAVIYLTREIKDAAQCENYGDERYENVKFQQTVAEMYKKLSCSDWKVVKISDDRSIEDVHRELFSFVENVRADVADKEIGELWTDLKASTDVTTSS